MPDDIKKVYAVTLQGGGDTYRFLVDEEIWNWINKEPSPEERELLREKAHFADPSTPERVQDLNEKNRESRLVSVTSGSFDNDKALACTELDLTGSQGYNSTREITEWLKQHPECELQSEEYEGYIY